MHLQQLKEEAKSVLPEGHPFLDKLLEWEPKPDEAFSIVVDSIEDWKRGMRDWSEVEDLIHFLKEQP